MTTNDAVTRIAKYLEAHPDEHIIVAAPTRAALQSLLAQSKDVFPSVSLSLGMSAPEMAMALDAFGLGGVRVLFVNIRMCNGWRVLKLDTVIVIGDRSMRKIESTQLCLRQAGHQAKQIDWEDVTNE